jgi:SRSO17 transposase
MIERAAGAAVPFAWVAGDEAYGDNGPLRTWLETQRIAYVLAVACDHRVPAGPGRTIRADQLAARLPGKACVKCQPECHSAPLTAFPQVSGVRERD